MVSAGAVLVAGEAEAGDSGALAGAGGDVGGVAAAAAAVVGLGFEVEVGLVVVAVALAEVVVGRGVGAEVGLVLGVVVGAGLAAAVFARSTSSEAATAHGSGELGPRRRGVGTGHSMEQRRRSGQAARGLPGGRALNYGRAAARAA